VAVEKVGRFRRKTSVERKPAVFEVTLGERDLLDALFQQRPIEAGLSARTL